MFSHFEICNHDRSLPVTRASRFCLFSLQRKGPQSCCSAQSDRTCPFSPFLHLTELPVFPRSVGQVNKGQLEEQQCAQQKRHCGLPACKQKPWQQRNSPSERQKRCTKGNGLRHSALCLAWFSVGKCSLVFDVAAHARARPSWFGPTRASWLSVQAPLPLPCSERMPR